MGTVKCSFIFILAVATKLINDIDLFCICDAQPLGFIPLNLMRQTDFLFIQGMEKKLEWRLPVSNILGAVNTRKTYLKRGQGRLTISTFDFYQFCIVMQEFT